MGLTLTRVVFECVYKVFICFNISRLTLTRVVFEYLELITKTGEVLQINLNKSCI